MKRLVYRIHKAGSIKKLRQNREEFASPDNQKIQIKVRAIGLNFADIFALTGLYSATPSGSFIPGLEFAGEVIAKGRDVQTVNIGDRVMGVTRFGAYATHLNCSPNFVFPLPQNWSYAEGAGFPVNVLTAYYGLAELGNLRQGQRVLISSVAGGVGIMANRIAHKLGAKTVGTIGHSFKAELLETEKVDEIWVRDKHYYKKLKALREEEKFDLVLDGIGGKVLKTAYLALAPQGRLITMGAAQYTPRSDRADILKSLYLYIARPRLDPLEMISENKSVMGFNLIWLWSRATQLRVIFEKIMQLNIGPPRIDSEFSFDQIPHAIRYLRSGKTSGKVIIVN